MILDRMRLDGKKAIVAGAGGGGIGTATSVALAEAGADVVAVDIEPDRVRDTALRVTALGRRCAEVVADLRRTDEAERVAAEAFAQFGSVDLLVNVAGGAQQGQFSPIVDVSEETWDQVFELNLKYVFTLSRTVALQMMALDTPGSIVNVATIGGLGSAPGQAAYGAAKAGLISLTRTTALEWASKGIRVNAVAPGVVRTPRVQAGDRWDDERWRKVLPLGRPCEPEEVAGAVVYLLSDLAAMVTGQTLVIDGGATIKFPLWDP
jgi:NAD(P)-dependent dehydrogenase (short-subunit alcohol dehydrogenase family)